MHRAQAIGGSAWAGLLRLVLTAWLVFVGLHRPVVRAAHGGVVAVLGGFGRACSASAAAPSPAPSWFGLLAVRHPSDSSCHADSIPPHSPVVTHLVHIKLIGRAQFCGRCRTAGLLAGRADPARRG